ncbi:IQ domain-containing protein IQM1-like [Dioscorea cayenensis subsp. rotundata]|uniref:IQ domain-containing protein IQM1-like n=1 Tax=Dioscorea cayennensis subsp. rotundata TaxID=55577 RepID=A0AB40CUP3_DIOCR|nr:IQ domain-containing protein IQM1-like [Dioscorea cayenensis subsp. rotundata]
MGIISEIETILVKQGSYQKNSKMTLSSSLSFKKPDTCMKTVRSCLGQEVLQDSLNLEEWEIDKVSKQKLFSPRPTSELDAAAVMLQKVYKSYRTRRNLADCAVVVEELWWKALDFASLKHSSISFFNVEKQETAISRWARARTRAAKVGKGLSKNDKAQKLALRHWLEAIDPRHRYGHNLHFYYDVWFSSESTEPFFYWLDVGDGKDVNLEKCPRTKLQQQCIKYLGPNEREAYEVIVNNQKLIYKQSKMLVNTNKGSKWIFVLSTSRALYVGQKIKGEFQHSSFLAGGATIAAGRLVVEDGILKAVWPYSGHYLPTEENFKEFINFLQENSVDLTNVKRCSIDDDEYPTSKKPSLSDEYLSFKNPSLGDENLLFKELDIDPMADASEAAELSQFSTTKNETELDINTVDDNNLKEPNMVEFDIHKEIELSKHLSCKWSTGAGPRIGCVRDYPADLQSRALEQVKLSPRIPPSPSKGPIPSPRPSPALRLSPRLVYMAFPAPPTISLTLPKPKNKSSA